MFPNIGKVGILVGGARGEGHVYAQGRRVGETVMNQLSIGFQLGAQDYSEIILFRNEAALNEFTSGNFEFDASASVTAIMPRLLQALAQAAPKDRQAAASMMRLPAAAITRAWRSSPWPRAA